MDAERFHQVAVEIEGRRYAGDWHVMKDGRLCVGGAYGSKVVDLGRAKPELKAQRTLREIVTAWRTR